MLKEMGDNKGNDFYVQKKKRNVSIICLLFVFDDPSTHLQHS